MPCPLCRQPGAVESWYPQGDVYYGVFRCENHGLFPVRMSVVHREDGSWQGRRVVPPLTDPERAAFAAARENAALPLHPRKSQAPPQAQKSEVNERSLPLSGRNAKEPPPGGSFLRLSTPGGGIIKRKKRKAQGKAIFIHPTPPGGWIIKGKKRSTPQKSSIYYSSRGSGRVIYLSHPVRGEILSIPGR